MTESSQGFLSSHEMLLICWHAISDRPFPAFTTHTRPEKDALSKAYGSLHDQDFVTSSSEDDNDDNEIRYALTQKGKVMYEHLLSQPTPRQVTKWVMNQPEAS